MALRGLECLTWNKSDVIRSMVKYSGRICFLGETKSIQWSAGAKENFLGRSVGKIIIKIFLKYTICSFHAIKIRLEKGFISRSAKICTSFFISFIKYSMNLLSVTNLYGEYMIESNFVRFYTSKILLQVGIQNIIIIQIR